MQIRFTDDPTELRESVDIAREFLDDESYRPKFFRYPFSDQDPEESVSVQIATDIVAFRPSLTTLVLQELWKVKGNELTSRLLVEAKRLGKKVRPEYTCVLTFYGPRGYYDPPETMYVNIAETPPETILATLLHELLHLVFEDDHTDQLDDDVLEEYIDALFRGIWGDLFPGYHGTE